MNDNQSINQIRIHLEQFKLHGQVSTWLGFQQSLQAETSLHAKKQQDLYNYVIGLHAVQFGNNWMRKIPRSAKLDEVIGQVQFGSPRNFFYPIISKLHKHVVLLPINYRASKNSLFKAKLNVRTKPIQFILNWTVCKN